MEMDAPTSRRSTPTPSRTHGNTVHYSASQVQLNNSMPPCYNLKWVEESVVCGSSATTSLIEQSLLGDGICIAYSVLLLTAMPGKLP